MIVERGSVVFESCWIGLVAIERIQYSASKLLDEDLYTDLKKWQSGLYKSLMVPQ
jgi:hypothetical protein